MHISKKNKTIYLHIGRHKTGTSSIQNFINANLEELSKYSLYYPEAGRQGIAHHEFAHAFSFRNTRTDELKRVAVQSDLVSELRNEIDGQNSDVLISSEALQNANPKLIAEAFSGYQIRTLVYVRSQIDYLASAYAQKVWATDYAGSIEDYYDIFDGNYDSFLASWEDVSEAGISVSLFSKQELLHSDIVADFFVRKLEIDEKELLNKVLNRSTVDSNPSLTSELLAYKLAFNTHKYNIDVAIKKRFMGALGKLSLHKGSAPVRVNNKLAEICRDFYKENNKVIADRYFNGEMPLDMYPPTGDFVELDYKLASKITADLISVDQELEIILKKFIDDEFSIGYVA